ncbi:hypothetical protein [Pedobacter suwonensis]|uniref:hypothetical protein n=1 Tax=Pedobacter suwonensis TaxID=332999 RepID=UPI0025F55174|nr:hypothetical protein [uncultured Pedobacter sp.]
MKQALNYSLKVTLTTLLFCLPITFVIMMGYINLLSLVSANYNFNVNLDIKDAGVFLILTFCALLFNMRKIDGKTKIVYNKRTIAVKAFVASVIIFLVYLLLFGKLRYLSIDEFVITYGPTFLITIISMRTYPLRNEESQAEFVQN